MQREVSLEATELIFVREGMGFDDGGEDEQAAVGRLSSMSLMAAVTASGKRTCAHIATNAIY